ncbi:hypothetical protein [Natronomonas sp. EA1]|uniref:hypothetical protein n=1 Tax=Natronomonas sp. EA1 TaxID=3421655 RepID=UPI003EBF468D
MYLSPTVRTIRTDPTPDESVSLMLRVADDADPEEAVDPIAEAVEVGEPTQFGDVPVALPESEVDALLDALPDVVEAVETADVVGMGVSHGEDM